MYRFAAIWVCIISLVASGPLSAGSVSTLATIAANGGVTLHSKGYIYAANFGNSGSSQGPRNIWKLSPSAAVVVEPWGGCSCSACYREFDACELS